MSASAAGSESQSVRRKPYSCSASSALACGSCTKVSTPNSCSSRMMSMTFELRMSGTSSLNVSPSTLTRSEEHTSELQSRFDLVCRLLLEKKKKKQEKKRITQTKQKIL